VDGPSQKHQVLLILEWAYARMILRQRRRQVKKTETRRPACASLLASTRGVRACYLMVSFRWLSSGICLTIVIL
jgi:hypothetical protein